MSLEDSIANAVSAALADKYVHTTPTYASRETTSAILGISPQSLDRLFYEGVLQADKHTTQFREKGRVMYYMPEILKTLQPKKATIMVFGESGR